MREEHQVRGRLSFGVFELDLRAGELRKHGLRVRLQEQPFQVLATLTEHPGEVVTREKLQKKLWPADTFVDFDHGLNKAISKIREALSDSAESPRFVETVARRGYRFLAEVKVADAATVRSPELAFLPHHKAEVGDSLAVLPLESLSSDASQDYFADGMTDELISDLGQISALRVISRTSVMAYKHARKPLPEIAR